MANKISLFKGLIIILILVNLTSLVFSYYYFEDKISKNVNTIDNELDYYYKLRDSLIEELDIKNQSYTDELSNLKELKSQIEQLQIILNSRSNVLEKTNQNNDQLLQELESLNKQKAKLNLQKSTLSLQLQKQKEAAKLAQNQISTKPIVTRSS